MLNYKMNKYCLKDTKNRNSSRYQGISSIPFSIFIDNTYEISLHLKLETWGWQYKLKEMQDEQKVSMSEWLRRQTRNLLGFPAQVQILLLTFFAASNNPLLLSDFFRLFFVFRIFLLHYSMIKMLSKIYQFRL